MTGKKEFYENYFKISNPYEYQLKVWELIENIRFPILLRAPTGSGKTEAVLAPFLSQFVTNRFVTAPRLLYVLPMRVLANSIADRIRKYAHAISPHISVEIHHGDIPNSPFFISDIVVTTLDQFIYAFARASRQVGYHIDVPAGAIASSMVVFDESHMYRDEFTFSIMRALMEILYHSNIPFVVMTATMPKSLESSLFENIPINDEQRIIGNLNFSSSKVNIMMQDNPLIQNGEVNIPEELLKLIKNKKTLVVLNQVSRAQRVYEELKRRLNLEHGQIVLLHSRFTRQDRANHEEKALSILPHKELGELRVHEGTGIVVSTQVLEAGVDFSVELLITEMAPADALIQRGGRCARYEGQEGDMIIFSVEGNRAHMPYEERHIERTKEWLNNYIKNFNIKNFDDVCRFVNETLDYQANDFEASDTLIDLYECVLYTDTKPENIQIRKDKSAKVIVVEPVIGESKRESKKTQIENGIRKILKEGKLSDSSFEVDIKVLWGWFKNGIIHYELRWNWENEGRPKFEIIDLRERSREITEEDPKIVPFRTYILESSNYNSEKGVDKDATTFI